ncbi:MAG: hypothetical protein GXY91_10580 [Clostridia bacterium]|nr:hypothetical protein [Clostridia bacterium]
MGKKISSIVLILVLLLSIALPVLGAEENSVNNENVEEKNQEKQQETTKIINTGYEPLLVIQDIEVDEEVAVGDEFNIHVVVRNMGSGTAFYPKFEFEEVNQLSNPLPNFHVVNSASKDDPNNVFDPNVVEIASGEVRSFNIKMKVDENAPERENGYKIKVILKCQNAHLGDKYLETSTNITLNPKYTLTSPYFVVKSVKFAPEEPDLDEPFTATFFFENISKTSARNVRVSLEGSLGEGKNNFKVLDLSNTQHLYDVKGKTMRMVSFKLEAEDFRDGNEVKLKFAYDYSGSSETKTQEEIINLPLPSPDSDATGKTPWVIINKYTLSVDKILAGNTVVLKLFIENTNEKDVNNVKVSIVDIQLEDNQKGDTVFSPVDSSNTFYIEKIPGKTIVEKDIALYVDPNAQAKTYNVPIDITYEYDNGVEKTVNERVNIPVTQECRFEVFSVDVPPVAMVGELVPVTSEFVNVGKVTLTNFMVNLEGDFTKENAIYYIGNMETGMSDFYQAMVIPEKEGVLEGKLVFSYIDNNNQEVRVEEPFTIEVQSAPELPAGMEMGPDGQPGMIEGKPGMPMGPDGAGGLASKLKNNWKYVILFIIILVQGVFIWRLKRKAKENGEFFDV